MSGSLPSDDPLVVLSGLDEPLAGAVVTAFAEAGVGTLVVERERTAAMLEGRRVTGVVVDVSTAPFEGRELCRRLHEASEAPVLALARDSVDARVALLEAGADDCLSKPFAPRELVARLRTVLRRADRATAPELLEFVDLRIDIAARRAWRGARPIELTRTEFALLVELARQADRVVSRRDLLVAVWGYDFGPDFHSLGVYVGYLRRKLEAGGEARLISTVRGVGYVLRDEH